MPTVTKSTSFPLQATVLEEMPPFPDRESSLLAKLYQTAPWTAKLHQEAREGGGEGGGGGEESVGGGTTAAPQLLGVNPLVNGPLSAPLVTTGRSTCDDV